MQEKDTNIKSKDYYLKSSKFVRDIVLGYVYLTEFDIEIIDTLEFQRLKDIRQLTCQHVYPSARHTRFEHSLGVMELTRQAIRHLNENKFLSNMDFPQYIFSEQLQFNASLAALLHDIGHCPFSHLGEIEFDKNEIWTRLIKSIDNVELLKKSKLRQELSRMNNYNAGAKHEQLSCIIILEKLYNLLSSVESNNNEGISVDFELIFRSILGIPYPVNTACDFNENKEKNIIINLINSKTFDMDKLDYIMRDSYHTGIGTPKIDTRRLFRNMYLNNENDYKLVFTHRAVPALQNMIESRDELYMYVYNHHTAVFSDFMCSYIFRRLDHIERDFFNIVNTGGQEKTLKYTNLYNYFTTLGIVFKDCLFSVDAVLVHKCSDSDVVSLFRLLQHCLCLMYEKEHNYDKYINNICKEKMCLMDKKLFKSVHSNYKEQLNKLYANIERVYKLINNYQKRSFLKPWWKTNSEFSNFINTNFRDDCIRNNLCKWICQDDGELKSEEFRSQLAKNVTNITRKLKQDNIKCDLVESFNNEEFFVIQRSARFFDPETIGRLDIALKSNEILGYPENVEYCTGNFYIKSLTNVIPQRNYYSMYAENSFYIFSKPLFKNSNEVSISQKRNGHYYFIEKIFVFVATTLINDGIRTFQENYCSDVQKEKSAHDEMYNRFKKKYLHL